MLSHQPLIKQMTINSLAILPNQATVNHEDHNQQGKISSNHSTTLQEKNVPQSIIHKKENKAVCDSRVPKDLNYKRQYVNSQGN